MRSFVLILSAVLSGCALGPEYTPPEEMQLAQFSGAQNAAYRAEVVPAKFWTLFNDDVLNGLIEDSLKANHDIRIAAARLREARAMRQIGRDTSELQSQSNLVC